MVEKGRTDFYFTNCDSDNSLAASKEGPIMYENSSPSDLSVLCSFRIRGRRVLRPAVRHVDHTDVLGVRVDVHRMEADPWSHLFGSACRSHFLGSQQVISISRTSVCPFIRLVYSHGHFGFHLAPLPHNGMVYLTRRFGLFLMNRLDLQGC